jgi:hypothetical protein
VASQSLAKALQRQKHEQKNRSSASTFTHPYALQRRAFREIWEIREGDIDEVRH